MSLVSAQSKSVGCAFSRAPLAGDGFDGTPGAGATVNVQLGPGVLPVAFLAVTCQVCATLVV